MNLLSEFYSAQQDNCWKLKYWYFNIIKHKPAMLKIDKKEKILLYWMFIGYSVSIKHKSSIILKQIYKKNDSILQLVLFKLVYHEEVYL